MNKGILLITGPTESGKTWLANCILAKLGEMDCVIWDEPDLTNRKIKQEIIAFARLGGLAIITSCSAPAPYPIKLDKAITLYA